MASPAPTLTTRPAAKRPAAAGRTAAHEARPIATVRFEPSGREIRVARGTSLIEAARRVGLPIASGCDRNVACGRCGVRVLASARPAHRETARERAVKSRNRIEDDVRLSCVFPVTGDLTVTTSYW